jgi:glycosyltransferase involved in cell wall biosynthesis
MGAYMPRNVVPSISTGMNIAYIADISTVHNRKWIEYFALDNNVIIFCDKKADITQFSQNNPDVKVYPILPLYPLSRFWIKSRTVAEMKRIIIANNIDIIHSMYAVPYSIWAYHLWFKNHIVTTRGSDILIDYNRTYKTKIGFRNKTIGYFMRRLVEKALNKAKYISSTSQSQQRVINTFIDDPEKLRLIRTGVNINDFIILNGKTQRNESITTILSNRSISALYNIDIIIDAFSIVRQKVHGHIRLMLINYNSDKVYYESIIKKINDLNIQDYVQITEEQNIGKLIQTYKNSDVVVMIPSSDGMPVSGIEAMLAKKPLIVGSIDYDNDIYNDNTVWKLKSISTSALADEIIKILNLNEAEIAKKTNMAYSAAIEFADIKKEVSKVEILYKSLI